MLREASAELNGIEKKEDNPSSAGGTGENPKTGGAAGDTGTSNNRPNQGNTTESQGNAWNSGSGSSFAGSTSTTEIPQEKGEKTKEEKNKDINNNASIDIKTNKVEANAEEKDEKAKVVTVNAKTEKKKKIIMAVLDSKLVAEEMNGLTSNGILKVKVETGDVTRLKLRLNRDILTNIIRSEAKSVNIVNRIAEIKLSKNIIKKAAKKQMELHLKYQGSKRIPLKLSCWIIIIKR